MRNYAQAMPCLQVLLLIAVLLALELVFQKKVVHELRQAPLSKRLTSTAQHQNSDLPYIIGVPFEPSANLNKLIADLQRQMDTLEFQLRAYNRELNKLHEQKKNYSQSRPERRADQDLVLNKIPDSNQPTNNVASSIAIQVSRGDQLKLEELENATSEMKERAEESLMSDEVLLRRLKTIKEVVTQTKVLMHSVSCKTTLSGFNIQQILEDGSYWVFTVLAFEFSHPTPNFLLDEYFAIRIVDTDTGETLPYLESNPNFVENQVQNKGFTFQWEAKPMSIKYINMQAKLGRNYELRFYFLSDEQEYLLEGGIFPIIRSNQVLKP